MSESPKSSTRSLEPGLRHTLSKNSRVFDIGEEPLLETARKAVRKARVK